MVKLGLCWGAYPSFIQDGLIDESQNRGLLITEGYQCTEAGFSSNEGMSAINRVYNPAKVS